MPKTLLWWTLAFTLLRPSFEAAAAEPVAITGVWEGESKCTVPESPCHDEHVIYEIRASPPAAGRFAVDAYKVVGGQKDFMGTLDCHYPVEGTILQCIGRRPDDIWRFRVSANRMSGTLTIGAEKQLFRTVEVSRKEVQ